jgi:N-acetylmuramoyl-L-alanine amidase
MVAGTGIAVSFLTRARRAPTISLAAVLSLLSLGAAWAETPGGSAPKSDGSSCARANFRVILDVGHTAVSPGAISSRGVDEYDFNLRLAKRVDQSLRDAGFEKTVLMVTGGSAIGSQYERVARANNMTADLLLSIHHDSVPDSFIEKWEFNGKSAIFSDRFKGHSIFVSTENIDIKSSILFGHFLGEQMKARGLQYTPHYTEKFMGRYQRNLLDEDAGVYRYDTLFVLKKSRMPAVLLEAGSIVNRDEELLMATPERQAQIGAAVTDAVESFCVAQTSGQTPQVAQSFKRAPQVAQSARRSRVSHARAGHRAKQTAEAVPMTASAPPGIDMR